MTRARGRFLYLLVAAALLLALLIPAPAMAASASASASSSTVKPGDTVTVKVSFKGSNIAAVQASFSYDSSVLQYVSGSGTSNGKIVLYASEEGLSSLSTSIKFKALKAGSCTVSVKASEILAFDESSLGSASASAKVTVKETSNPKPSVKPSSSPKPSSTTRPSTSPKPSNSVKPTESATPSATPTPTINPLDNTVAVEVEGKALRLWPDLSAVTLPEGYTLSEAIYQSGKVDVAKAESGALNLVYLTDEAGAGGAFYILDAAGNIYPYRTVSAAASYILMQPDSSVQIPAGYAACELAIGEQTVSAWRQEDGSNPDFYLLYALGADGKPGFYFYDKAEGSMQRYADRSLEIAPEETQPPADEAVDAQPVTTQGKGIFERIFSDTPVMITFLVIAAGVVALAIIVIALAVKTRKLNAAGRTDSPAAARGELEQGGESECAGEFEPEEPESEPQPEESPEGSDTDAPADEDDK